MDTTHGATCNEADDVAVKQAAIANAVQSHLVVDSSKHGLVASWRFADRPQFASIITDDGVIPNIDATNCSSPGLARRCATVPMMPLLASEVAAGGKAVVSVRYQKGLFIIARHRSSSLFSASISARTSDACLRSCPTLCQYLYPNRPPPMRVHESAKSNL